MAEASRRGRARYPLQDLSQGLDASLPGAFPSEEAGDGNGLAEGAEHIVSWSTAHTPPRATHASHEDPILRLNGYGDGRNDTDGSHSVTSEASSKSTRTLRRTTRSRMVSPPASEDGMLTDKPGEIEKNLDAKPAPASSHEKGAGAQPSGKDRFSAVGTEQASSKTQSAKTKPVRGYPLQSPASNHQLRAPPTPPLSSSDSEPAEKSANVSGRDQPVSGRSTKSSLRQRFPLQTPPSIHNLRQPPSEPVEKPVEKIAGDSSREENDAATKSTRGSLRQRFPLQTPPSIHNLRQPPTPPLSPEPEPAIEPSPTDQHDAAQERRNKLAADVVKHWRRMTYPIQSPDTDAPPEPFGSLHDKEAEQPVVTGPIHLPKHMRAATAADEPTTQGRTIVVCLDGTGDKFDNDNSNIVHLVSCLKKDDPNQITYYQAGIGTYGEGGLSGGVTAALDMAVGYGLGLHVRDAYHFLMHSYKEGDKICIFGFSRGAYTARCLAGMIHKVGLLPPRNLQQIPFAYEFYKDSTPEGWKQSAAFKDAFSIDVNVYFLGVFDSVSSVGIIPRQLPLSSTPNHKPVYFRHAMALDERRAKFKVGRHQEEDTVIMKDGRMQVKYTDSNHPNLTDQEYEDTKLGKPTFETDVKEVWFAGCHGDVGGGATPNEERHKLAEIPLRWMIRQAFECNTGIIFKTVTLAEHGLDVHTLWPKYHRLSIPSRSPAASASVLDRYDKGLPPRSVRRGSLIPTDKSHASEPLLHFQGLAHPDWTPEQLEDSFDALCPMWDALVLAKNWWILEFYPVEYKVPTGQGKYITKTGMNLGRYRGVEDAEPNVHWTVIYRMEQMGYKIQARTAGDVRWRTVI